MKLNKGTGGASDLAVAVILDSNNPIEGLNDSKKITEKKREELYRQIIAKSLDYCIMNINSQKVDRTNILENKKLGIAQISKGK